MTNPHPTPICAGSFQKANWSSAVCDLLQNLLLLNDKLFSFFSWMFTPTSGECHLSPAFGAELVEMMTPIGSTFWSPFPIDVDASVWVPCEGQPVKKKDFPKLYEVVKTGMGGKFEETGTGDDISFTMPDLSGRLPMNRGKRPLTDEENAQDPKPPDHKDYIVGTQDGVDEVELTAAQSGMGVHQHGVGTMPYYINSNVDRKEVDIYVGELLDDPNSTDANRILVKGYDMGADMITHPLAVVIGDDPEEKDGYGSYHTTHVITSKPIADLSEDEDGNAIKGEAHNNMPPYHVGVTYMRANFKINGQIIEFDL